MAYDEGLAELVREELGERDGLTEKRMFGGLAFLLHGHMVCAVSGRGGALFRVGKQNEAEALALGGVGPMQMTGRRMGGFVDVSEETMADDVIRLRLMGMALATVAALPPK